MGIYGHRFDNYIENNNQNALLEQYLTEMHISKNDLKNPNILKKVLEKSEKEQNIANSLSVTCPFLLGIAADVVSGIIAGSILTSIALFIPFIIGSLVLSAKIIEKIPVYEQKNVGKLVKKAESLKAKTMRMKDCKEKQEILRNCDNVLNAVDKYKKHKIDEAKKKEYENAKKFLADVIKITKGDESASLPENPQEFYDVYELADKLGIMSPGKLDKVVEKICTDSIKYEDRGIMELFCGTDSIHDKLAPSKKDLEALEKKIPGFKNNIKVCIMYAIDDTVFFFNPKNKTFVYGDYFPDTLEVNTSLYQLAKKYQEDEFSKEQIEMYKSIYEEIKGSEENK